MTDKPDRAAPDKPKVDEVALIYATFPDFAEAEAAAGRLLDARLIACANILPGMTALYTWQGRRERATEVVALFKTRAALAEAVIAAVRAHHPYETPALLTLAPEGGLPDYLAWIVAETSPLSPT
jgi:periplasmic divalent cation tolerance protein